MPFVLKKGKKDPQLQADHLKIMTYCFNGHPQAPHKPLTSSDMEDFQTIKKVYESTFHYVVYEDDKPLSAADYDNMEINIRGKIFKNGAIQDVCTLPEGRRKGHTKEIFNEMFQDFYTHGYEWTTLYPFKPSFYEQFGYAGCGGAISIMFQSSILRNLLKFQDPSLKLERTTVKSLGSSFIDEYMKFLCKVQSKFHGFCTTEKNIYEYEFSHDSYCCVVRREGELVGFMPFNQLDPKSRKIFTIDRKLVYLDENVKKCLLNFVALHMDSYEWVRMELPPGRDTSQFITDLTTKRDPSSIVEISMDLHYQTMSPQMGRIVILEKMTGISLKCRNMSLVAQIKDNECSWNNDVWKFEALDGKLVVERAKEEKTTLWLDIRGISALILGSIYDATEISSNGWGNPTEMDADLLSTMFPYQIPVFFEKF